MVGTTVQIPSVKMSDLPDKELHHLIDAARERSCVAARSEAIEEARPAGRASMSCRGDEAVTLESGEMLADGDRREAERLGELLDGMAAVAFQNGEDLSPRIGHECRTSWLVDASIAARHEWDKRFV